MNKNYASQIPQIIDHFSKSGNVSLQEFLCEDDFNQFLQELAKIDFVEDKQLMSHQYTKAKLTDYMSSLLLSDSIKVFLQDLIGISEPMSIELIAMQHRDFNLRKECNQGFLVFFSLNGWVDVGGDVFVVDNQDEALLVPKTENTLTVIKTEKEFQEFFTYVNHHVEDDFRLFVRMTF